MFTGRALTSFELENKTTFFSWWFYYKMDAPSKCPPFSGLTARPGSLCAERGERENEYALPAGFVRSMRRKMYDIFNCDEAGTSVMEYITTAEEWAPVFAREKRDASAASSTSGEK